MIKPVNLRFTGFYLKMYQSFGALSSERGGPDGTRTRDLRRDRAAF